jgi:hypothetical protein
MFYVYLVLFPGIPLAGFLLYVKFRLMERDSKKRQPFDSQPRPPGWSLQQRIEDTAFDGFGYVMGIAVLGLLGSALYFSNSNPWPYILLGGGGGIFCAFKAAKSLEKLYNQRLGLKGELLVGARLEELRSRDCLVFHDLEFSGKDNAKWNIDHVLLAPSRIYIIETKCRRKNKDTNQNGQKGHEVIFDGTELHFPFGRDSHGLEQARRNADHLKGLLEEQNAISLPVDAVLVLPGWYVKTPGKGPVRVLNEKQLAGLPLADGPPLDPRLRQALAAQLAKISMT